MADIVLLCVKHRNHRWSWVYVPYHHWRLRKSHVALSTLWYLLNVESHFTFYLLAPAAIAHFLFPRSTENLFTLCQMSPWLSVLLLPRSCPVRWRSRYETWSGTDKMWCHRHCYFHRRVTHALENLDADFDIDFMQLQWHLLLCVHSYLTCVYMYYRKLIYAFTAIPLHVCYFSFRMASATYLLNKIHILQWTSILKT